MMSTVEVNCTHESLLMAGRYKKLSREVSQTPWIVENGTKTTLHGSVETHISDCLKNIFGCEQGG